MPTLHTPTMVENLWANDRLFVRYKLDRGISLLVKGGVVTATQYPYQEDLADYDYVYMGGRDYDLSDAEVTILTDAGYGAYIT